MTAPSCRVSPPLTCRLVGVGDPKFRAKLFELTKGVGEKCVPVSLLQERLQSETLRNSELLDMAPADFDVKARRLRTQLFYKQKKYNLMREDSEG